MTDQGSGGVGAVSLGISEALVEILILAVVLFGLWKLGKLLWAALSS